jgi:UDP-glucose 4-epimerase
LDSLVTGHRLSVPAEAQFIQADVGDSAVLGKVLAAGGFEAVMHFAAFIEAGESMSNPGRFYRNNLANSLELIEAAAQAGVRRFVLSSTAAVYRSSEAALTEDSELAPTNVYGHTKLVTEQALDWYSEIHGLHFAALRYFNACGAVPGRGEAHRPESHLIPRVLDVALGREARAHVNGTDYPTPDGTCIRDYIHVADLVSAHLLALEALERETRLIYNIGSGTGHSVREVIETAREVTGRQIDFVEGPRRPGDPPRLVASSDRIQRELGWQPEYGSLGEIVASAWEWHRSHPKGYDDA